MGTARNILKDAKIYSSIKEVAQYLEAKIYIVAIAPAVVCEGKSAKEPHTQSNRFILSLIKVMSLVLVNQKTVRIDDTSDFQHNDVIK